MRQRLACELDFPAKTILGGEEDDRIRLGTKNNFIRRAVSGLRRACFRHPVVGWLALVLVGRRKACLHNCSKAFDDIRLFHRRAKRNYVGRSIHPGRYRYRRRYFFGLFYHGTYPESPALAKAADTGENRRDVLWFEPWRLSAERPSACSSAKCLGWSSRPNHTHIALLGSGAV